MSSERLCAGIKGVNTNLMGSAKQEDGSSPPFAWQRQTAHQPAHKGGNCNNGMQCSPLSPPESRFSTPDFHPFLAPWRIHSKDAVLWTMTTWSTACVLQFDALMQAFYTTGIERLTRRRKKGANNEVLVKKSRNSVKSVLTIYVNFIVTVMAVSTKKQKTLL